MSNLSNFLRGAVKVSYSNSTSGLTAVNLQSAVDEVVGLVGGNSTAVSELVTLSGVAAGSTDLGTFTGSLLSDALTLKGALQEVEDLIQANIDSLALKANDDAVVHKSGDVMTGNLRVPQLHIGSANNGYLYQDNITGIGVYSGGNYVASFDGGINAKTYFHVSAVDGSATNATIRTTTASDTGLYSTSPTNMNITVDGTQVLGMTSSEISALVGINLGSNKITSTYVPQNDEDLVNKAFLDSFVGGAGYALDSEVIKHDGTVAFTGDQSMGGFKLTNLATPLTATDAATKGYIDALVATGVRHKGSVVVKTDSNIDLATGGLLTVDSIALSEGDLVLVDSQTNATENGIYVASSSAWVRAENFDGNPTGEIQGGDLVLVNQGTVANTLFFVTGSGTREIGTDDINFDIYSRVENSTASNGIVRVGLDFQLSNQTNNGISVNNGAISTRIDGATIVYNSGVMEVGTIQSGNIADNAVITQTIADGAVTDDKIDSVSATKVDVTATGSVTATDAQGALEELAGRLDTVEAATSSAWAVKAADYTAVEGDKLLVDTTSQAVAITLPAAPTIGQSVIVRDAARNTETNAVSVLRNGLNIEGAADDITFDVNGSQVEFVYVNATIGWSMGIM